MSDARVQYKPETVAKVEYWLSLGVQFTIVMDDGGRFAKSPRDLAGRVVGYNERQPNVDIMRHIRAGGIPGLIPATMGLLNLDYDVDEDDVIDDAPMRAWWREGDFKRSAAVPSRTPGRYHKWLVLHKDFRNNFNTAHPRPELGPWEIRLQGAHTILWNLDAFVAAMSALKGSNFVTNADIDDLRPPEALRREKARVAREGDYEPVPDDLIGAIAHALSAQSRCEPIEAERSLRVDTPFDLSSRSRRLILSLDTGVAYDFKLEESYSPLALARELGVPIPESVVTKDIEPDGAHVGLCPAGQLAGLCKGLSVVSAYTDAHEFVSDAYDAAGGRDYTHRAIKALKGEGKTHLIMREIARHTELWASGDSVLYITTKRANVDFMAVHGRLRNYATMHPREFKDAARLAVTTFSLHKVKQTYKHIFIDEVNTVMDDLTSPLQKAGRHKGTFQSFAGLIQNAETVFVTGADIRPVDVDALARMADNPFFVLDMKTARVKAMPSRRYKYRNKLIADIVADVCDPARSRPVVGVFDGKRVIKALGRMLADEGFKGLSVYEEAANRREVKAFIEAPNDHAAGYDFIFLSPKVQDGLSIDVPVHAVYGCFAHNQISAEVRSQMLHRARNAAAYNWCSNQTEYRELQDVESIRARGLELLMAGGRRPDSVLTALNDLHADLQYHANHTLNHISDRLAALELLEGHPRVELYTDFDDGLQDVLKAAIEQAVDEDRAAACDRDLKPKADWELAKLALKGEADESDYAANVKHNIQEAAKRPITEALYDRFHRPATRVAVARAEVMLNTEEAARAKDEAQHEKSHPLHLRSNHELVHRHGHEIMRLVTGKVNYADALIFLTNNWLPSLALEAMRDYVLKHKRELSQLFGMDARASESPTAIFKLVTKRMGLKRETKRIRVPSKVRAYTEEQWAHAYPDEREREFMQERAAGDGRYYVYGISEDSLRAYTRLHVHRFKHVGLQAVKDRSAAAGFKLVEVRQDVPEEARRLLDYCMPLDYAAAVEEAADYADNAPEGEFCPETSIKGPFIEDSGQTAAPRPTKWLGGADGRVLIDHPTAYKPGSNPDIEAIPF